MIMGAEKSHSLPSESWRPRKTSGNSVQRPDNQGTNDSFFWRGGVGGTNDLNPSPREEDKMRCDVPALVVRQRGKKVNSSFLYLLFCSGSQGIRECPPIIGRAIYFKESADSNVNLILIQIHPKRHPEILLNLGTYGQLS